jgi:hypothetical protein
MRLVSALALTAVFLLPLARSASAAGLGPTKGSQLVTVYGSGSCSIPGHTGNSLALSKMVAADGTVVTFTIPPKKILVVTDVLANASGEQTGNLLTTTVIVGSAAGGTVVAGRFESALPGGGATAAFDFSHGVAVRTGSTICVQMINLTQGGDTGLSAFAHGYFAPDK